MRGSPGLPTPAVATFAGHPMSTPPTTNGRPADGPQPAAAGAAPPHSIEAEQSVLGAMLLSDRTHYAFVIEEGLKVEDFYRERHREVYESMLALFTAGESIDVLTVTEHLRSRGRLDSAGGQAEIDALDRGGPRGRQPAPVRADRPRPRAAAPPAAPPPTRSRPASTATRRRRESSSNGRSAPSSRSPTTTARRTSAWSARSCTPRSRKWQELSAEGRSLTGTPSGFADLDSITGGFQPGNLIIIAARPSMGKCLNGSALVYDPMTGARRAHGRGRRD